MHLVSDCLCIFYIFSDFAHYICIFRKVVTVWTIVGLREVLTSEKVLGCRSLLKAVIDVWKHVSIDDDVEGLNEFISNLSDHATELQEVSLDPGSANVARLISASHISPKTKCVNYTLRR